MSSLNVTIQNKKEESPSELIIFSSFQKKENKESSTQKSTRSKTPQKISQKSAQKTEPQKNQIHFQDSAWTTELVTLFKKSVQSEYFKSDLGETLSLNLEDGKVAIILGLGEKSKLTVEQLRKQISQLYKSIHNKFSSASIMIDGFLLNGKSEESLNGILEGLLLSNYAFDRHLSTKRKTKLSNFHIVTSNTKAQISKWQNVLTTAEIVCHSIHFARDLVNEAPNILNSETYAKEIEKDAKDLKNVKVKILGKKELQKENMGMFLSVNAGSHYAPQLVHLTYTPPKSSAKTKHIALVGKGLTFDTGGYSLKPAASIMNMKFDMAGSATVYAAFKAAVEAKLPVKISCFLGMTDNAVSSLATMPDSIVKARNGKTVEILNTDAEGRLVLGDVVNYACDFEPDVIIDAATLTGAILVSLGSEVCGLFSNDDKLANDLLKAAESTDEYMWRLPIIEEHKNDMKSLVADLKNIGGASFGGSAKGAAFIQAFLKEGISWAHLDIAGVGDSQSHLPYCPNKGASGLIVRTLFQYLKNQKA